MKNLPTYIATLDNGVWIIKVTSDDQSHNEINYTIPDEVLSEDELYTLTRGTSNDIQSFINYCGYFNR